MIFKKNRLINYLELTIREYPDHKYRWLSREELTLALRFRIVKLKEINVDQGDGTYKTVVDFMGKDFVYVGEIIPP